MKAPNLSTERLILRHWNRSDYPLFAEMCQDKRVMEHFPEVLTKSESLNLGNKLEKQLSSRPYGLWAVQLKDGPFIGFTGLHDVYFEAPFTPAIEIGWRLAYQYWGKGYAYEAASSVIDYAFNTLNLQEIVSFTATTNKRSQRLMQRLNMTHDPKDDFDHPKLPDSHILKKHVLYRLRAQ